MKCKKRQEAIQKAFATFMDDYQAGGISIGQIFRKGAQWADENPCLDKFWHDKNDKPEEGPAILINDMLGWEIDNYCEKSDGKWYNYIKEWSVVGWMYLDEFTNTITKLKDDNSGD